MLSLRLKILPLFLFTLRSGISQNQILQSLTKYLEKSINIKNIILASLESSSNVLILYEFSIINVNIFSYIFNQTLKSLTLTITKMQGNKKRREYITRVIMHFQTMAY
jgi:hypothetical protein